MTRHTVILHTDYFFSFDHAKAIDWEHAKAIINCKLIEITKARWDGKDYNMLLDEEGALLKNRKINHKATSAYQAYWFKKFQVDKNPDLIKNIQDMKIYGNALIIEE
jgi:hypothetical protein